MDKQALRAAEQRLPCLVDGMLGWCCPGLVFALPRANKPPG